MAKLHPILSRLYHRLERLQVNESVILSTIALIVGLIAGVAVWVFKIAIELAGEVAFNKVLPFLRETLGSWAVLLLPVAGGLVVGLIVYFFVGEERHHGVAGIMEAVALAGGRLRYKRIPAKSLAAAISIGSGASVGPEDPSVQIGSNIGSMIGQWLHFSDGRIRALVAAGAAAGIAAAFNAPIAGVFFALEIILGEITGGALGVIVIASVVSAVFTQAVSGVQPAFAVPRYAFQSAVELPLYLGLGLLAGPVASLYVQLLYAFQDLFHAWRAPRWIKPAAAGLVVGGVGIFLPEVFGIGYETIENILQGTGDLTIGLLAALLVAKLLLTPVSIGGGFMGGVFAPSLFLGATLGGAYGMLAGRLFPGLQVAPPAYAMVGMAAVLAGAVHAPLTAIILLFEMTNDYRIILPLMFAVVVSLLISQLLQRDSVYMLGLARKGIRLDRGRDMELLQAIRVEEVMQTQVATLREEDPLQDASQVLMETRHHGLPVVDERGGLVGVLTLEDIDRAEANDQGKATVGEVCTRDLLIAYPDETIGEALRKMGQRDVGRLPVVARDDPRRLVGLLRRLEVVRAYDVALTRRAALRHRAHQVRLGAVSPEVVSVGEFVVQPEAACAGQPMKAVGWPPDCIIASLRRGREVLIPNGNTVLQSGDVLVAVAGKAAQEEVQRICNGNGVSAEA